MRRTLLSVLVAIVSFVVTASVLVVGYTLVAGRSMGPSQGHRTPVRAVESERPTARPSAAAPATTQPDASSVPASAAPTGDAAEPSDETDPPAAASAPTAGLLSQDFRKLGLDDPSTLDVDESLRSACEVVGGVVSGPALCDGR